MANGNPIIPFKNFRFLVKWDGQVRAAISKVSGLKRTSEVISHREGNDVSTPRHAPGRTSFQPITLERGVTKDPEFEAWANLVFDSQGTTGNVSLAGYKKDITIEVKNQEGKVVRRYNVHRAWVSEYTAQADLDANANAILIESIVLQNEGWERDTAVGAPVDPDQSQPADGALDEE
jgi:phage tail-like protein